MTHRRDDPESVVDVLTSYHHGLADDLRWLRDTATGDPGAETGPVVERVVTQLVGVLVAEEQYVLPEVRRLLPDGDAAADAQFTRHRELEHQLRRLEDLEHDPDLAVPVLDDVTAHWAALTEFLEGEALPVLGRELSPERAAALGDEVLGAIQAAPTRPRPVAPRSPSASKVVSLAEGFVDRVRDGWSHRGQGEDEVDV